MLIDARHAEETRVVVLNEIRLGEFDYETASQKQLKGNIYLAKVTRVEPSLQAAFVEYGGNRHGFLPFSEIHPDYYRIPIADREALIAAEAAAKAEARENDAADEDVDDDEPLEDIDSDNDDAPADDDDGAFQAEDAGDDDDRGTDNGADNNNDTNGDGGGVVEEMAAETRVDTLGGDEVEDAARRRARLLRKYKIQEVIKRRQVILIQVTKEERGNKGAALTTYLSLAGRYCVLMPNTAKGGGISRKISSAKDRRRLKSIIEDLTIPDGMAVIVRTAGSERTKAEIRRDYEFLLRLWGEIRSTTLESTAPSLIYEEANLIKRSIRDLYQSDMEDVLVEGEASYKAAKSFMKTLMPSHARKVKLYKDPALPLFFRYKVEGQIDAMHDPVVRLKSGGYLVINITEALVAIDVNSGKATRERHIEETAYKTNLEAADEVARHMRLRDLAGLIVIDFIDMEESRHNRAVERRLKEAVRNDRARIQLGRISPFGLLEMSRQRLRPSLFESSTVPCPTCRATGYVRTPQSAALHVLRGLEEEGIRRAGGEISVSAPTVVALYLLNDLRDRLVEIEQRHGFRVRVRADNALEPSEFTVERTGAAEERPEAEAPPARARASKDETGDRKRGRPRRRRKRADAEARPSGDGETPEMPGAPGATETEQPAEAEAEARQESTESASGEEKTKRKRRGKRGGRRRSRRPQQDTADGETLIADDTEAATGAAAGLGPEDSEASANPETTADAPGETDAAQPTVAADGDAGAEPSAPPRKPRRPRRRKRATAETETPPAEAQSVEPAPSVAPELESDTAPAEANHDTTETADLAPEEIARDSEPKRRGWWQRWT